MNDTPDAQSNLRAPSNPADGVRSRRPWVPPTLIRHASLTALTLQYPSNLVMDPRTGELLDPNNPEDRVKLADVPGSTGFFP